MSIADQPEQQATEEIIQSFVNVQGYSQKQLSHVSVRTDELARLLSNPIAQSLATVSAQIESEASTLRQAFDRQELSRNLQAQRRALEIALASKQEQAAALARDIGEVPTGQRAAIDAHPSFLAGQRLASGYKDGINGVISELGSLQSRIARIRGDLPEIEAAQPAELLSEIRTSIASGYAKIFEDLKQVMDPLRSLAEELSDKFRTVEEEFKSHSEQYFAATSENAVIQNRLDALRKLSEEIDTITSQHEQLNQKLAEMGDTLGELQTVRQRWVAAIRQRDELLESQAVKLTADSLCELRVTVNRGKNVGVLKKSLVEAVRGAAITIPDKLDNLIETIHESVDPVTAWLQLGEELLELSRLGPELPLGAPLPPTPMLTGAQFIPTELRRIATRLTRHSAFELTLSYPESDPAFEYRTADGTYIPFEDASPGQQATALICLLLNQQGGPLLIDQLEDDLDNLTILSVAERLWTAKEKRQLIFTTHNPNLLVIGDAELVLQCDYQQAGHSSRVHIPNQRAIDNRKIRDVITHVMEGGEQAFSLRKQKYGF